VPRVALPVAHKAGARGYFVYLVARPPPDMQQKICRQLISAQRNVQQNAVLSVDVSIWTHKTEKFQKNKNRYSNTEENA